MLLALATGFGVGRWGAMHDWSLRRTVLIAVASQVPFVAAHLAVQFV